MEAEENPETPQSFPIMHPAGATDPDADQFHGRLVDDFRANLERDRADTYRRWGYALMHSLEDADVHTESEAMGFKPEDALDHYNQGCAAAAKEDAAEAIKCFKKALSIDPELGEAQFNLAVMLGHQGKAKEAREAMNAYIEHNTPSDEESEEIREFLKNLEGA